MKAIINKSYGPSSVLESAEIEQPQPGDHEVLIKVHATGLNKADWFMLTGRPLMLRAEAGLFRPKRQIIGSDVAGVVEAVGKGITRFQVGDEVYGDLSENGRGGLAEYVCAPEAVLAHKPSGLTFEQAAAVPMAAMTALQGLRDTGNIQAGQKVLVNGASGGVGTYAVQIAKALGAEVTAVCSTQKADLVRELGADHVIDYTAEDFTQSGKQYDLIFAANGFQTLAEYQSALSPSGTLVVVGGSFKQIFSAMLFGGWRTRGSDQTIKSALQKPKPEDLATLAEMLNEGQIRPVIDQTYPLEHAAEAMAYLGQGSAKGKLVISVI